MQKVLGNAENVGEVRRNEATSNMGIYQTSINKGLQMTVTIQQTAKIWKLLLAIGSLSLIGSISLGILCMFADIGSEGVQVAGLLWFLAGVVAYTVGRVGAWWANG